MTQCINKKYLLGVNYRDVILNHREAMCMRYLLENFSITEVAKKMKLSTRTISFYISNVMLQLKCNTLQELLDCIKQSELLRYF